MNIDKSSIVILMADDDLDDCEMAKEALHEAKLANDFRTVNNGEELLEYLNNTGNYTDAKKSPRPGLILLDLNMPKKDGREALKEIKDNPNLRSIPVIVLTTSTAEEDIYKTYDLGVSGFITKPVSFDQLVSIMSGLSHYWLDIVRLPGS